MQVINNWVWGTPLLVFLALVGIYLTIVTRGVQFRYLWYSHKLAFSKQDLKAEGDISHFQSLMTALAATIGIGSISGVATAIAVGGLGALFWMWVAAIIGMATKYGEAILAICYRIKDKNGEMAGGPMYYLERGLGSKPLGMIFAALGALTAIGTGNLVQANSVSGAFSQLCQLDPLWVGLGLMVLTGVALVGGIKSIGKVVSIIVPVMAIFYISGGLLILLIKYHEIPRALVLIFKSAFTGQAACGGFVGSTMILAIQLGVSRGVFSSEAGLGSSPIAAAAAKTDSPAHQALVSMSSVFITTGIVCTITGLAIALTQVVGTVGVNGEVLNGSALALAAFDSVIPHGGLFVTIALIPFAYSTILGWAYYGEKCTSYLLGTKWVKLYRIFFTILVLPGALLSLEFVWSLANILNGLMAIPNLIGLFLLASVIRRETKIFDLALKREKGIV